MLYKRHLIKPRDLFWDAYIIHLIVCLLNFQARVSPDHRSHPSYYIPVGHNKLINPLYYFSLISVECTLTKQAKSFYMDFSFLVKEIQKSVKCRENCFYKFSLRLNQHEFYQLHSVISTGEIFPGSFVKSFSGFSLRIKLSTNLVMLQNKQTDESLDINYLVADYYYFLGGTGSVCS